MKARIFLLWLVLPLFSSCGYKMSYLKSGDDTAIPEGHGIVVIGLTTNTPYQKISITGEKRTALEYDLLKKADPFIITTLPAGEYEFDRIWLNSRFYVKLDSSDNKQDWSFTVLPNNINYVGNFVVTTTNNRNFFVRIRNFSTAALEFLEKEHKPELSKYPLRYTGSDKDSFFQFVKSLPEGVKND